MSSKRRIAVIGAGAFGGWSALYLLRRGAQVTLIDAWGPGNSRSSSGDETRIMRCTYGANQSYSRLALRATQLWKQHEELWRRPMLNCIGVLWMARGGNDQFERESVSSLRDDGVQHQELSVNEIARRWPQINLEDIAWGIYEPGAGYLLARFACQTVLEGFLAEGGEYRQAAVLANGLEEGVKN